MDTYLSLVSLEKVTGTLHEYSGNAALRERLHNILQDEEKERSEHDVEFLLHFFGPVDFMKKLPQKVVLRF